MCLFIGIAGGSGSGKTTFAHKIQKQLNAYASSSQEALEILHMDSYYLPDLPQTSYTHQGKANFDHPDAFDWPLLRQHFTHLKAGNPIWAPLYDFKTSTRLTETKFLGPCQVVIIEGIFTLFDEDIRQLLDIKCFLHVDSDIRFTRRLHRDVKTRGRSLESVIEQYYETVRPMYLQFLEPQKQYADFTIGEETDVAASLLAAKIHSYLLQQKSKPQNDE